MAACDFAALPTAMSVVVVGAVEASAKFYVVKAGLQHQVPTPWCSQLWDQGEASLYCWRSLGSWLFLEGGREKADSA